VPLFVFASGDMQAVLLLTVVIASKCRDKGESTKRPAIQQARAEARAWRRYATALAPA